MALFARSAGLALPRLPSLRARSAWRGGVGGGGSVRIHRCINRQENARHVFQHVVIPEPQHTIAIGFEISRTYFIGGTVRMLTAVNLDDESSLMAGELGEEPADRCLTPEMMLLEGRLSQMLPELFFGFGRVVTQSTSARHACVNRTLRSLWHAPPTPDPSPPRASRAEGGGKMRVRQILAQTCIPVAVTADCPQAPLPLPYAPRRRRRPWQARAHA